MIIVTIISCITAQLLHLNRSAIIGYLASIIVLFTIANNGNVINFLSKKSHKWDE